MRLARGCGCGVICLIVGLILFSVLPTAWGERGFGGRVRRMGFHSETDPIDIATVPKRTLINWVALRPADGPVIATWTGHNFVYSQPPRELYWDLAVIFEARRCLPSLKGDSCAGFGDPIPAVPVGYQIAGGAMGFQQLQLAFGGAATVRVVWPAGLLEANRTYRFEAWATHGDHQHCDPDAQSCQPPPETQNPPNVQTFRLLTVEAYTRHEE